MLAVLQKTFAGGEAIGLQASMWLITLLSKGKKARALLDNYRPITLINTDHMTKLLAKALATFLFMFDQA